MFWDEQMFSLAQESAPSSAQDGLLYKKQVFSRATTKVLHEEKRFFLGRRRKRRRRARGRRAAILTFSRQTMARQIALGYPNLGQASHEFFQQPELDMVV